VRYRGGERYPRWSGYTAFVLSGGGARGALQVGMLRALFEHGERPDVIVGTSIGAWNGAWLAKNPTLDQVKALEDVWHSLTTGKVLLGRDPYGAPSPRAVSGVLMLTAARRVAAGQPSLYGDAGGLNLSAQLYGDMTFEQMAVPLRVVAANLSHGGRTVFGSGPVAPTVLASSAIPGVFPPVRVGASVYVDGGALENVSLDVAVALGARRLFVLDVGYDTSHEEYALWASTAAVPGDKAGDKPADRARANGASNGAGHALAAVLERTVQVMSRYHLETALRALPAGIEVHLLRPNMAGGMLDFSRSAEWMAHGYDHTRAYLERELPRDDAEIVRHAADTQDAADELVDGEAADARDAAAHEVLA
jgi:predicted acylesterase/phospholipase RssA